MYFFIIFLSKKQKDRMNVPVFLTFYQKNISLYGLTRFDVLHELPD